LRTLIVFVQGASRFLGQKRESSRRATSWNWGPGLLKHRLQKLQSTPKLLNYSGMFWKSDPELSRIERTGSRSRNEVVQRGRLTVHRKTCRDLPVQPALPQAAVAMAFLC
jgi:hypothetical protein